MENIIEHKSFEFAARVVRIYQYLTTHKHEFVMSKQLLRSGQVLEQMFPKHKKDKARLTSI